MAPFCYITLKMLMNAPWVHTTALKYVGRDMTLYSHLVAHVNSVITWKMICAHALVCDFFVQFS